MPKEVKAYACTHGCGRRVQTSRKSVEKHEATCAANPARRACKTCKHKTQGILRGDAPGVVLSEPLCSIGALPCGALMHFNCEQWELRE